MARPKKDGKRATGIYGKHGSLYIVMNQSVIENGSIKNKRQWISTGLKDTQDNIKRASEKRLEILQNKVVSDVNKNILVSQYVEVFLDRKQREVKNTTYVSYYYKAAHIKRYFAGVKIKNITKHHVEIFLDDLFTVNKVQHRTVKDIKGVFNSIMEMAIKDGIITSNPVKETTINKNLAAKNSKAKDSDDDFFSYNEAILFLQKAENNPLYELFYITLFFGLRREEVIGLKWSAVDLANRTMQINHTVTKGMAGVNRLNSTKTESSNREYPLSDEQINLFMNLKRKEEYNRELFGKEYQENDYIFKHEDGTTFYPDYPTKIFKKIIKANPDLPQNITLHGLRSSCVSILIHSGFDVRSIQNWVGHSDPDTTLKIYAKVKNKESKKEISDNMSKMFKPIMLNGDSDSNKAESD